MSDRICDMSIGGSEFEGSPISAAVPVHYMLRLANVDPSFIPPTGDALGLIPPDKRGPPLNGVDLARYGLLHFEPPFTKEELDALEAQWHPRNC